MLFRLTLIDKVSCDSPKYKRNDAWILLLIYSLVNGNGKDIITYLFAPGSFRALNSRSFGISFMQLTL